jgi:hypothetical protein
MRARGLFALALAGCSGWRSVPVTTIDSERAMVFTDRTAYVLDSTRVEADKVVGTHVHAWHITTCSYDAAAEPAAIAHACDWQEERQDEQPVTIDRSAVRNVRVKRYDIPAIVLGSAALSLSMFALAVILTRDDTGDMHVH